MGNKLSRLCQASEEQYRVGMLGLDNAGKTTTLYQLKSNEDINPTPTVGFNVENVNCGDLVLNIWDVNSSQPGTRLLWQHYNRNVRAIIFVIDCTDMPRLPRAAEELRWLLERPELENAVFLIFANKQDLPDALRAEQLIPFLQLPVMKQKWAVQECCATKGVGLKPGLEQLEKMLEETNKTHCV